MVGHKKNRKDNKWVEINLNKMNPSKRVIVEIKISKMLWQGRWI